MRSDQGAAGCVDTLFSPRARLVGWETHSRAPSHGARTASHAALGLVGASQRPQVPPAVELAVLETSAALDRAYRTLGRHLAL